MLADMAMRVIHTDGEGERGGGERERREKDKEVRPPISQRLTVSKEVCSKQRQR